MPEVSLGRDSRLMTWSSNLNIYRVNRFHPLDLGSYGEGSKVRSEVSWYSSVKLGFISCFLVQTNAQAVIKFDLIEALLMRNMIDEVEDIFSYVGLESVRECLLVSKLWHDFLSMHFFRRCADNLVQNDDSIRARIITTLNMFKYHFFVDSFFFRSWPSLRIGFRTLKLIMKTWRIL